MTRFTNVLVVAVVVWVLAGVGLAVGQFQGEPGLRRLSDAEMRTEARGGAPDCDKSLLQFPCWDMLNACRYKAMPVCEGECTACTSIAASNDKCSPATTWTVVDCREETIPGACGNYRDPFSTRCTWTEEGCRCLGPEVGGDCPSTYAFYSFECIRQP